MLEDENINDIILKEKKDILVGKVFYDVRRAKNVFVFAVENNKDTFVDRRSKLDYLCVLVAWAVGKFDCKTFLHILTLDS